MHEICIKSHCFSWGQGALQRTLMEQFSREPWSFWNSSFKMRITGTRKHLWLINFQFMWAFKDIQESMDLNICQWHAPMLHVDDLPAFNYGIYKANLDPTFHPVSFVKEPSRGHSFVSSLWSTLHFKSGSNSLVQVTMQWSPWTFKSRQHPELDRKWDKPWWTHALTETSLRWWRDLSHNWNWS